VEVGDLRSDLHDQAYALDPSQIRQGDGTDASQTPLRAASEAACRSLQRRSALSRRPRLVPWSLRSLRWRPSGYWHGCPSGPPAGIYIQ
jgi:hypothetical protein